MIRILNKSLAIVFLTGIAVTACAFAARTDVSYHKQFGNLVVSYNENAADHFAYAVNASQLRMR